MYDLLVDHPTTDPELISYVRPELRELMGELEQVKDCWELLKNKEIRGKYLHQEPGEPDVAYESRLQRSTYTPVFRDAIRAFAGLLGNYQISEPPKSLDDHLENVDLQGSSLAKLLNDLDQMVLRDGGAAVLVEMPPEADEEPEQSFLEEIENDRRPYLVPIERCNIINWRTTMRGGREVVESAVIRTVMEQPCEEGRYGVELIPVYVHLVPGAWRKVKLVRSRGNARWTEEVIAEGQTTLPVVPLAWFGATGSRFGIGSVPLRGLSDMTIQHFQLRSDLSELLHKLSMPVPVRKGASTDQYGRPTPILIGPNTAIDLPVEGDFMFAEPSGSSLAQHQEEITHLEQLMDRSTLTFMYGSGGTRTATEAMLQGAQVQAQVATLIENKESCVDMVFRLWAALTSEQLKTESGIEISDNLIQRPLEAQEVQAYLALFGEHAISHQTLLEELKRGHALSQDVDVEEEMERVEEERKKAQEEAIEMMQMAPGPGDTTSDDPADHAPKPQAGIAAAAAKGKDPKDEAKKPPAAGKPAAKAPAKGN